MRYFSVKIKGGGGNGTVEIYLKKQDNTNYAIFSVPLSETDTQWKRYVFPLQDTDGNWLSMDEFLGINLKMTQAAGAVAMDDMMFAEHVVFPAEIVVRQNGEIIAAHGLRTGEAETEAAVVSLREEQPGAFLGQYRQGVLEELRPLTAEGISDQAETYLFAADTAIQQNQTLTLFFWDSMQGQNPYAPAGKYE